MVYKYYECKSCEGMGWVEYPILDVPETIIFRKEPCEKCEGRGYTEEKDYEYDT